jgi:hypothetical protein
MRLELPRMESGQGIDTTSRWLLNGRAAGVRWRIEKRTKTPIDHGIGPVKHP